MYYNVLSWNGILDHGFGVFPLPEGMRHIVNEQLHASLTSPSTMPCAGWSCVKHAITGLWSSGKVFCGETNHAWLFSVWWVSLGLKDARRTLPTWLHCANCKLWWKKSNGIGCFLAVGLGPYFQWSEIFFFQQPAPRQCYASDFVERVWERPFSIWLWLCLSAQSKAHTDMVGWVWCDRTWLAHTEPWPQPHRTPLGWTGKEIVNQIFSSNVSAWPHKYSTGWLAKILTEALPRLVESLQRGVEADRAKRGPAAY